MNKYIVIDIGGSAIKHSLMYENGEFISKGKTYFKDRTKFEEFSKSLVSIIKEYEKDNDIAGIAMSVPGAPQNDTGVIEGNSAIPCIHGPNFKEFFNKYGYQISMDNDGNCAAIGEAWLGAAKDLENVILCVIGSGIGGGIISNGQIHRGKKILGGEFGSHIHEWTDNGLPLNWHQTGSVGAIKTRYFEKFRKKIDAPEIFKMAKNNNKECIEIIEKFYKSCAMGIFSLQSTFDPDVILIAGAVSERDDLIPNIERALMKIVEKVDGPIFQFNIKKAKFGNDANLIGALKNYLNTYN